MLKLTQSKIAQKQRLNYSSVKTFIQNYCNNGQKVNRLLNHTTKVMIQRKRREWHQAKQRVHFPGSTSLLLGVQVCEDLSQVQSAPAAAADHGD